MANKKIKYLHIISEGKFHNDFIDFINKNFDPDEHLFLLVGKDLNYAQTKPRRNVKKISKNYRDKYFLVKKMNSVNHLFLHGLFSNIMILFLQPWLLKRCNWVVWGGELYKKENRSRKNRFKTFIIRIMKRFIIRNIGGIITYIRGEYELIKKKYGSKGKYHYSLMYPSNVFNSFNLLHNRKNKEKIYIQVGNSAVRGNNHLEVFNMLEKYKSEPIEIICPLSYGDLKYREKVIKEGKRIFGDKFNPIIRFMPLKEYRTLLSGVDIAIFNRRRQHAMGNIISLLGLGKKVYIRNNTTTWQLCIEHGLKVYNLSSDFDNLFKAMPKEVKMENIKKIKKDFSEEKLKEDWNNIFKCK